MENNIEMESLNNDFYQPIEENVLPPSIGLTHEQFLANVRSERNTKLIATDWTVLPDSPLSNELKQQYIVYRQALRDITEGLNSYQDLVWPIQPE
jgi:hypothetical protein